MSEPGSIEALRRPTGVQRWTLLVSSVLLMLGILGLLRSGLGEISSPDGRYLFLFLSHPVSALVYLALGLVGIYANTRLAWARTFLAALGGLMVTWALLGLALDGEPNDAFTSDRWTIALHVAVGVVSLLMSVVPARDAAPAARARRAVA